MHLFDWIIDAQKTTSGKIISVVLSVALIFSFSMWSTPAFADEVPADSAAVPADVGTAGGGA